MSAGARSLCWPPISQQGQPAWPRSFAFFTRSDRRATRDLPRDAIPTITHYPDGQATPTPSAIDFTPGHLLGDVSGELGLRPFLEAAGHTLVVTSDKEGPNSELDRQLVDADVVISQPFWPAYLTRERIARAPRLKLAITAGIGSDHVDLTAAAERGITVAEITFSNSVSVAEHVVMMVLSLVRDYIPQHEIARRGGWNIADAVCRAPMTSRACSSAPSPPVASASPCCDA